MVLADELPAGQGFVEFFTLKMILFFGLNWVELG
jgi:hypothetical protein